MKGSFYKINPFKTPGWSEPFRVEFVVYGERLVMLKKVEAWIEFFQIYKDITSEIIPHSAEMDAFIDKVENWVNSEHYLEMQNQMRIRRLESFNPDDDFAA